MVIPRFGLVRQFLRVTMQPKSSSAYHLDYPYEQMDVGGRWFDHMRLDNATKLKIGRGNANQLFSLNLSPLPERAAAGFAGQWKIHRYMFAASNPPAAN